MKKEIIPKDINRGVWPMQDGKPVITQSMVNGFTTCPRETYYSTVLGLRPRLSTRPLTRGTWMHSLLEAYANGEDWRKLHRTIQEEATFDQFEEECDDLAVECYNIMSSYEWVYRDDPLIPIKAELTVERPMFHGQALYRGRIDLIVKNSQGDIWLLDHKTHRTFPDWQYRELAFQHYSYLWAVRKAPQYLELGIPQPKGFIYDYCKTGTIKTPTLKKNGGISRTLKPESTTYPVVRQWLIEHGLLREIQGKDLLAVENDTERSYIEDFLWELQVKDYSPLFRRDWLTFSPEQQNRQMKAFFTSAKRMLQYDWGDPDCVERNLSACCSYLCRYRDLTLADLMHGDSSLEQITRYVSTDNPLDYYPNQDSSGKPKQVQK